jgi:hypothetical protein
MPRELVALLAFASLVVLVASSSVVFWKNGQRSPTWPEWKAGLKALRPWHVAAFVSGVLFASLLAVMKLSPASN